MKTTKNKIVYEENINSIKGKATAIVFPDSADEIKNIVRLSGESTDIIARGSGTSFTGAVIPRNSVVIDFSKMNKILMIDSSKKLAVVEPGVLLSEFNEELASYGLEFPIMPIFGGIETIGGMLAKNSSGNREIKYGRMISWTDSLQIINSNGEQARIAKSDLSDFVGMEGTTGIIVQATLRLTNKKERSMTILKANTLQDVFLASRKLKLKQDVCSVDIINPDIASHLGMDKKYHLFVELDNNEGFFKGEDYEHYIKLKSKAYKKAATELGCIYISNAKFLIDSLQDFLTYLEEKHIPYISHLASGVVFPFFRPEQIIMIEDAMKTAKRLKGKIAYNFGAGLTKKDALEIGEAEIIRRVKMRNDPHAKFNRDKLVPYSRRAVKEAQPKAQESEKQPEQKHEKIEGEQQQEQKHEETQEQKPEQQEKKLENPIEIAESQTLKRPEPELSPEERDKIKKIAAGFFGGRKEA